mmetsp:Transcript_9685/g.22371  ORF Transcript_9685/g.22371 Transcript_9685/m.22371 type:complete len:238 (-) Transcript_9685:740-1453(-)
MTRMNERAASGFSRHELRKRDGSARLSEQVTFPRHRFARDEAMLLRAEDGAVAAEFEPRDGLSRRKAAVLHHPQRNHRPRAPAVSVAKHRNFPRRAVDDVKKALDLRGVRARACCESEVAHVDVFRFEALVGARCCVMQPDDRRHSELLQHFRARSWPQFFASVILAGRRRARSAEGNKLVSNQGHVCNTLELLVQSEVKRRRSKPPVVHPLLQAHATVPKSDFEVLVIVRRVLERR